jgi:hypothetical protein
MWRWPRPRRPWNGQTSCDWSWSARAGRPVLASAWVTRRRRCRFPLLVRGLVAEDSRPAAWHDTTRCLERVTRTEPALSARESVPFGLVRDLTCGSGCPRVTMRNPSLPGLMARRPA